MEKHEKYIAYMHELLDEDITQEHEKDLKEHLQQCENCQNHFHELEKSIALIKGMDHITAPVGFTKNVMKSLPKENKRVSVQRWLRNHPFLSAASFFLILMIGSLVSTWTAENSLSVSKQPNLIIENDTVIVPEGEIVKGDVVVQNGTLRIEGYVDGDVTVINGKQYLAAAGQVSGEINEINEIFGWIWFKMKNTAKEIIDFWGNESNEQSQEVTVFLFLNHV